MASLVIAALPVHAAATILLAATSKSPIKAATTDVREDDFLRLPIGNVAIASLCKMRGYLELVSSDGWRRVRLLRAPAPQECDGERGDCQQNDADAVEVCGPRQTNDGCEEACRKRGKAEGKITHDEIGRQQAGAFAR
jgi:hypothetical protein